MPSRDNILKAITEKPRRYNPIESRRTQRKANKKADQALANKVYRSKDSDPFSPNPAKSNASSGTVLRDKPSSDSGTLAAKKAAASAISAAGKKKGPDGLPTKKTTDKVKPDPKPTKPGNTKAAAAEAATRSGAVKPGKGDGKKGGSGKAGKAGKGSKGSAGPSGGVKTGSETTAAPTLKSKAQAAVDLMLNPKINELQRLGDTVASEYTQQKNDLNADAGRQISDLSTLYKQLDTSLGELNQGTQSAYDAATAKQGSAYDNLQAALQGVTAQQQQGVGNELARLGLGDQAADTSQLTGDAAFMQGLTQSNKAQAAATLAAMQANAAQYGNATRGAAQAQGSQAQAVARQSAMDMLYELLNKRNDAARGINSQIADTQGQRGALENQLMEQYEQQAYERMMEQQQQNFMNQMGVNKFNLSQDQFNADQAYRLAQLELAGQELELDAQKANNPANVKNAGLPTGFPGAQQYLQKNMTDPNRLSALTAILQKIATHRQRGKGIHDFSQGSYSDVGKMLNYGYSFLDDPGFQQYNGPRSRSLLAQALQAYFGKA
ncbi:MAG TPA: hypothetical protein VFK94_02525 [Patescibacteria group bacterium]|nr:hypothetical protein [Patescibacteria group bacterium]